RAGSGFVIGVALAAPGLAMAFAPVQGRTPVAWLPIVVAWFTGTRSHRSTAPVAGVLSRANGNSATRAGQLPPWLDGCQLISVASGDQAGGAIRDHRLRALTAGVAWNVPGI